MNTASESNSLRNSMIAAASIVVLVVLGYILVMANLPAVIPFSASELNLSASSTDVREYPVYARHPETSLLTGETRDYPVYVRRSELSLPDRGIRAYPVYTRHPAEAAGPVQASTEVDAPPFTFIRTH
jgi:hypothetical protein